MLIVALVLAAVGLAALVTAVVTGNEVLAFVCIAAAVVGVVLMIIDAIRDRHAGALKEQESTEDTDPVDTEAEDTDRAAAGASRRPGTFLDESADSVEDHAAQVDPEAGDTPVHEADAPETVARPAPATAAVSLKEVATAAHHPTAEETYERFDEVDDEDEPESGPDKLGQRGR